MKNLFLKEIWIAFKASVLIFSIIMLGMFMVQKYPQLKKPLIMAAVLIPVMTGLIFMFIEAFGDLFGFPTSCDSSDIKSNQPDEQDINDKLDS